MEEKLNIIEAMKMPPYTEFKVLYDCGYYDTRTIKKLPSGYFEWSDKEQEFLREGVLMAKFIPIPRPVSFNEVLNSDSKCKVEHWRINDLIYDEDEGCNFKWLEEYQHLDDIIHAIGEEFNTVACKEILKDGKWYLED